MIFVTVGAQMPFDRLISTVDEWAGRVSTEIFAQIGPTKLRPRHIQWIRFLEPAGFLSHIDSADLLVAHAGMGSIITALEHSKPLLIMPRRGDLGETRNDHQVATARRFQELGLVHVAYDEHELTDKLDRLASRATSNGTDEVLCPHRSTGCAWIGSIACQPHAGSACPHLIDSLRGFVVDAHVPRLSMPKGNVSPL